MRNRLIHAYDKVDFDVLWDVMQYDLSPLIIQLERALATETGGYEVFTGIVDEFDWAFCQLQYNLVNEDVQAGTKGVAYAAARGLGVIVMEPLFGGTLAKPPEAIAQVWQRGPRVHRPADVALRWLWNRLEVSLVLSGMSRLEEVVENIASASHEGPWLDDEETQLVAEVRAAYQQLSPIPCTKCGYCMPCPHGVNIPVNFELYNNAAVFQGSSSVLCRNLYGFLPEAEKAAACAACGDCEEKCPQGIAIRAQLKRVQEYFAANS
jgi:uncharacterized protein